MEKCNDERDGIHKEKSNLGVERFSKRNETFKTKFKENGKIDKFKAKLLCLLIKGDMW